VRMGGGKVTSPNRKGGRMGLTSINGTYRVWDGVPRPFDEEELSRTIERLKSLGLGVWIKSRRRRIGKA